MTQPNRASATQVPLWLAATIIALLLGVFFVAGMIVRDYALSADSGGVNDAELEATRSAYESDPSDTLAALEYGFALQRAAAYGEAIEVYDRVLATTPEHTAALYNKGMCQLAIGEGKRAEETLWQVLEVTPAHAQAAKALGEYYAGNEHYRSLLVAVEPAAEANPTMADLQYLVGLAEENLGDTAAAAAAYRNALEYNPDLLEAREGLRRLGQEP